MSCRSVIPADEREERREEISFDWNDHNRGQQPIAETTKEVDKGAAEERKRLALAATC